MSNSRADGHRHRASLGEGRRDAALVQVAAGILRLHGLPAGFPTFSASPSNWLADCGRGRYRDAATHTCRSPLDFGRLNGAAGSAGQKEGDRRPSDSFGSVRFDHRPPDPLQGSRQRVRAVARSGLSAFCLRLVPMRQRMRQDYRPIFEHFVRRRAVNARGQRRGGAANRSNLRFCIHPFSIGTAAL